MILFELPIRCRRKSDGLDTKYNESIEQHRKIQLKSTKPNIWRSMSESCKTSELFLSLSCPRLQWSSVSILNFDLWWFCLSFTSLKFVASFTTCSLHILRFKESESAVNKHAYQQRSSERVLETSSNAGIVQTCVNKQVCLDYNKNVPHKLT
jgi:hypothetical protein